MHASVMAFYPPPLSEFPLAHSKRQVQKQHATTGISSFAPHPNLNLSVPPLTPVNPRSPLRPVCLQLSQPVMAKIWDLSDESRDGKMDVGEFIVAMHLCTVCRMSSLPLPDTLPAHLRAVIESERPGQLGPLLAARRL